MDRRQSFGLLGTAIVFCGAFSPVLTAPVFGNISYLLCGKGDGTLLLVLAIIALYFTLKRKYRALWYTGLASCGLVLFTFYGIHKNLSELDASTAQTYHLTWGWAVLALGVATILTSAMLKENGMRINRVSEVPET